MGFPTKYHDGTMGPGEAIDAWADVRNVHVGKDATQIEVAIYRSQSAADNGLQPMVHPVMVNVSDTEEHERPVGVDPDTNEWIKETVPAQAHHTDNFAADKLSADGVHPHAQAEAWLQRHAPWLVD